MDRLAFFMERKDQPRMWWFQKNDYLPQIYASLSDEEFQVLADWFDETEKRKLIGECNVPMMSAMLGFIEGNGIDSIVQLGHYSGYSTLMLGWALRRMGKKKALFTVDNNASVTAFAHEWIKKADLEEIICFALGNSSDQNIPHLADLCLKKPIKMVFIDSSHQYAHTLEELKLWYEVLAPSGLIFLHDTSKKAIQYDTTNQGGVKRALNEFRIKIGDQAKYIRIDPGVYQDSCGIGIIQKM